MAITKSYRIFLLPILVFLSYFSINYFFLFSLTTPSDPLQYVLPALAPENGFDFLDRVLLWLWIRFVALLPISPEYIGGIATLILSSLTLAISVWFLNKKIGVLAGAIFFFLYLFSPVITGIASYTYPMQLLTFVLLVTLIGINEATNPRNLFFIAGFGCIFLVFSKIQGASFIFFILFLLISGQKNKIDMRGLFENITWVFFGGLSAICLISLTIVIIDGTHMVPKLARQFFSNTAAVQFAGRAEGGIPPVYKFLYEPTFIIALFFSVCGLFSRHSKFIRLFAVAALSQFVGLMLIYLITQRGGPVISNYFLDFQVIGLIVASAVLAELMNQDIKKYNFIWIYFFSILAFVVLIFLVDGKIGGYAPKKESLNLFVWLFVSFIFFLKGLRSRFLVIICLSILVLFSGYKVIEYSKGLQSFANIYHVYGKSLGGLHDVGQKAIWVNTKVNSTKYEDGSFRLKQIFNTFYKKADSVDFIFSAKFPKEEISGIITDHPGVLLSKCGHENCKGMVSIRLDQGIPKSGAEASSINKVSLGYEFRFGGLRGSGKLFSTDKEICNGISYIPSYGENRTTLQIDFSKKTGNYQSKNIIISSEKSTNNIGAKLFIQYLLDGAYQRIYSQDYEQILAVHTYVPEQATKVSFGYYFEGEIAGRIDLCDPKIMVLDKNNSLWFSDGLWFIRK